MYVKLKLFMRFNCSSSHEKWGSWKSQKSPGQILLDLLSRIRHSLEMTTLKGIYSHDNFMDVIGGMDFFELFRFEKEHFMVLLDVLQIPDKVLIHR